MNQVLEKRLKQLPVTPGVYFHKNSVGEILYIGKAANLRNRVRSYFQAGRAADTKTDILVSEIADIDWTEVETEADALFLEAELVRRYQPRFNILLRDDKSLQYVRIDYKSDYPTVTLIRQPLDDKAESCGPYINGYAVKKALRYLRRAFPYAISKPAGQKRTNLFYHLGLDPGLEEGKTSLSEYRANLRKLMRYLRGQRLSLTRDIERDMKRAARAKDFEQAAHFRNQLQALQQLSRQILFSDRELQDASKDLALVELATLLGLPNPPRRIEGFDISHMQGTDTVASMVVFISGLPDKASYRKFKMRLAGNDDFAHMAETIRRRLREDNRKKWGVGDLMLIDGGRGQLSAAIKARDECQQTIPMIGLAKRQEEIIISKQATSNKQQAETLTKAKAMKAYVTDSGDFISIELPKDSNSVKLLQRIRDESHRFAVSYHSTLKRSRQTTSVLDQVPGVGPLTRKKLIRHFGSAKAVISAEPQALIDLLGPNKGRQLGNYFSKLR
jgi:excinuclease ABC subunit C